MKNILLILSILISTVVYSQSDREVKIHHVRVEKQSGNLIVNFSMDIPEHAVKSKYKQLFEPIVYNKNKETFLPIIEIIGRNRAKREKQERLLAGNREYMPETLIAPEGETLSYTGSIPYADWMDTVSLRVERIEKGCCKEKIMPGMLLAEGISLVPKPQPKPVIIEPTDIVTKQKVKEQQLAVYFRFNQAGIDDTYMDNTQTLKEASTLLKQNEKARIEISGFASPEGNQTWNEKLAYRRAQALERYFVEHGWTKPGSISIVSHSINWKGLRASIAESDQPFKAEVLKIIDNTNNSELTNRKLQQLQGGIPYRYLVTKVYPQLRTASFLIINF